MNEATQAANVEIIPEVPKSVHVAVKYRGESFWRFVEEVVINPPRPDEIEQVQLLVKKLDPQDTSAKRCGLRHTRMEPVLHIRRNGNSLPVDQPAGPLKPDAPQR